MAPQFWWDGNRYRSEAGFSVERVGRDDHRYFEGDRTVLVPGEMLTTGYVIYAYAIKRWDPPHQRQRISRDERIRIVENVTRALESEGEQIKVHWS